jgi:hypothetical protein
MKQLIRHINPATIAIPALFYATCFTISKSAIFRTGIEEQIRIKKLTAVTCSAAGLTTNNSSWPNEKNDENGCSHQQGAGVACDINSHKRRLLKVLNC